jgi:uncharacterized membrane protein
MDQIVKQSNKVIKQLSKQALKGHYWEAIVLLLVIRIFTYVPGMLVDTFAPCSEFLLWLMDVYAIVISGPLKMASYLYFLARFRNLDLGLNALPASMNYLLKSFVLHIMISVRIALWAFLFIVPGIFAAIRYSQAFFILAEHPEYTPSMCLYISKQMMRPNMGRLISLILSYLPWIIIAETPRLAYILYSYRAPLLVSDSYQYFVAVQDVLSDPITMALSLLTLFVIAHVFMGQACFYDIASGKLIFQSEEIQPGYTEQNYAEEN